MLVSMTYLFYAITQCCESETGTSGTEIFCLSGTRTGMYYGSIKWNKKVKNETSWNNAASDVEKARFCTILMLLENCQELSASGCLHPEPEPNPELKLEPESKLFKVGTGTTALLVSKFLSFSVSYVIERKITRAHEFGAFVYLSGMKNHQLLKESVERHGLGQRSQDVVQ